MVRACDEREVHHVGRRTMEIKVQRRRKRGRPHSRGLRHLSYEERHKGMWSNNTGDANIEGDHINVF